MKTMNTNVLDIVLFGDDTNVTVYADNPETSEVDGLLNGHNFIIS